MSVTVQQLSDELNAFMNELKVCYGTIGEEYGLTKVQLAALHSIDKHKELPMRQIADVLHCDASNVTGIVDRLVGQDLVTRKEHPTDRRTKILHLTPKGQAIMDHIRVRIPHFMGCNKLDAAERTTMCQLVRKMRKAD